MGILPVITGFRAVGANLGCQVSDAILRVRKSDTSMRVGTLFA